MNLQNITSENWVFKIERAEKLPQGIHLWYKGVPFPRRVYHDKNRDVNFFLRTLEALGTVKKFLFSLTYLVKVVIPWRLSIKKYEGFLARIDGLIRWNLAEFYIKDEEYSIPVWEFGKFIHRFLWELGLSIELAANYARFVMMVLEFDCAYRYRMQDILGQTTRELMQHPRKELKRLVGIYDQREGLYGAREKISKLSLLRGLLLLPKIKRSFRTAIQSIDIEKIKLDENDRYHVSFWRGYDYFGQDFNTRYQVFLNAHKDGFPPYQKREDPEHTANFMLGV